MDRRRERRVLRLRGERGLASLENEKKAVVRAA